MLVELVKVYFWKRVRDIIFIFIVILLFIFFLFFIDRLFAKKGMLWLLFIIELHLHYISVYFFFVLRGKPPDVILILRVDFGELVSLANVLIVLILAILDVLFLFGLGCFFRY